MQAYKLIIPGRRPGELEPPAAELRTHEGHEWLYVLNGRLWLVLGDQDLELKPGEAAEFDTRGGVHGRVRHARKDGELYVERLRDPGVPVEHDRTPGVDHYFLTENPTRARRTMAMISAAVRRATEH